ncbi:hypothetical protein BDV23DRAFT_178056 [Aspergillus alliaceus]|uniref:Rhodopsin domain-containing protein n=1 Tax=Petromyces alliaceus TaxID=209559 RepID=A0A5N7CP89_PETAA|nr:hypothetical protein BDV23DRAFT_178056 [Aspergillus alliaceus]
MTTPEYWSRLLIALSIAGAVLATLFYFLRLCSHHLSAGSLDAGDIFLGLGLLLSYGITITTVIATFEGVGEDISTLPAKTARRVTMMFWITQKFWPPSQVCVKVSIIILLRRLLGTVKIVRSLTIFLIVFTVSWGLAALLANTFQCWPPQYFWNKDVDGYCIHGQKALFMATGAVSLLEDIVLLITPIAIVWRLQMSPRRKILVTILFAVGGVVCVCSLMRLIEFRDYHTGNLSESGTKERVWTLLEIDLAIVCASVVLMPPIFRRCAQSCKHRYHQSKGRLTASEYTEFEDYWPFQKHCTNFSQDRYSEVRAQAYRTPNTHKSERRMSIAPGEIRVETSINRCVDDRDALWPPARSMSLVSGTQMMLTREMRKWSDDMSNVDLTGVGFGHVASIP